MEYVIQKGDTLSKIAQDNNTTVPEIMARNSLQNPNRIYAGKALQLPEPPQMGLPDRNPQFWRHQDPKNEQLRQSALTPMSSSEAEKRLQKPQQAGLGEAPSFNQVEVDEDEEFVRGHILPVGKDGTGYTLAWPKPVYDAFKGFQEVLEGKVDPYVINPETGQAELNPKLIETGTAMGMISMTGGLAGVGGKGVTAATFRDLTPDQATYMAKQFKKAGKRQSKSKSELPGIDEDAWNAFYQGLPESPSQSTTTLTSGLTKKGRKPKEVEDLGSTYIERFDVGAHPLSVYYNLSRTPEGGVGMSISFFRETSKAPRLSRGRMQEKAFDAALDFDIKHGTRVRRRVPEGWSTVGLAGAGRPAESRKAGLDVLSTVVDSVRNAVEQSQPAQVSFLAAADNLIPLYQRFASQLAKEFGGEYYQNGYFFRVNFNTFKKHFEPDAPDSDTVLGSGFTRGGGRGKGPSNDNKKPLSPRAEQISREGYENQLYQRADGEYVPWKDLSDADKYMFATTLQKEGVQQFQATPRPEGQVLSFEGAKKAVEDFAKANKMTVKEVLQLIRGDSDA